MDQASLKTNPTAAVPLARGMDMGIAELSRIQDPAVLASIIKQNETTLRDGWTELDRLTQRLEMLNAREKSIIQKDLQTPQPTVKAATEISQSA
jgi:hypothetical protein